MYSYSEVEIKLVKAFDFEYLLHLSIPPHNVYRTCAEFAFIHNITGPHVDALRRVLLALQNGGIYRMTEQFDALASF